MRITLYGFLQYDPTLFDGFTLPEGLNKSYTVDEIIKRSGDLFPYHQQPDYLKHNISNWFNRNYFQFKRMIDALMEEYSPIENYDRYEDLKYIPGIKRKETHSGKDIETHSGDDTTAHSGTDKEIHSGDDTTAHSGTDNETHSGDDVRHIDSMPGSISTTTNEVSAYDSSIYSPHDKSTVIGSGTDQSDDTFTHGESVDTVHNEQIKTTHGESVDMIHGEQIKTTHGESITDEHGHIITNEVEGTDQNINHVHGNIGVKTAESMIVEELELRKFDIYNDIARRFEKEFLIQVY